MDPLLVIERITEGLCFSWPILWSAALGASDPIHRYWWSMAPTRRLQRLVAINALAWGALGLLYTLPHPEEAAMTIRDFHIWIGMAAFHAFGFWLSQGPVHLAGRALRPAQGATCVPCGIALLAGAMALHWASSGLAAGTPWLNTTAFISDALDVPLFAAGTALLLHVPRRVFQRPTRAHSLERELAA